MVEKARRLLSVKETAEYLGLKAGTIYNRVCRKSKAPFPVKPKRIGKRQHYRRNHREDCELLLIILYEVIQKSRLSIFKK